MSDDIKYTVGYRRPPEKTRFKAGTSGNPKGRPKGSKNIKTYLEEEGSKRITLHENGKPRRVSKGQAMVMALYAKAIKGDAKAAATIMAHYPEEQNTLAKVDDIKQSDEEILQAFYDRMAGKNQEEDGDHDDECC